MRYAPAALHLPDGFLSPVVAGIGWLLALLLLWQALRVTQRELEERQVPLMGVVAAFVFAAQAINFPIAAGTSGHLIGAALAAILLGPWAASLVMSSVIVLQGFLFQDGGLLVMGWNIINMGVLASFVGRAAYDGTRRILGNRPEKSFAGAFLAGWLSLEAGAVATAVELGASATFPLAFALPAMAGVHALIGLVEASITMATVVFLTAVRPSIFAEGAKASGSQGANLILAGLALALVLALLSPWGSTLPDGLEAVLQVGGRTGRESAPAFDLLPDYTVPMLSNPVLTTMIAVAIGTLVVFGLAWALGTLAVGERGV